MQARVATARAKGDALRQQLEDARPRYRSIDVAFVSLERDAAAPGSVLGAAVAFRVFLFVVPYAFVLVYGLGLASSAMGGDPRDVAAKLGIVGLLASTITVASEQSLFARTVVFGTALFALVSTSRSLLKVLVIVHTLTWQLPPPRRKLTRPALILILVVTAALALLQLVLWLRDQSFGAGLVAELVFIVVPASVWLVLSSRFFVHAEGATWRDLLPGAVLVGIGIQVLHFITVYWITRLLESKSETYGAVGAGLAFLFWAYLIGRIFTAAAVLNAGAWQQRLRRSTSPVT